MKLFEVTFSRRINICGHMKEVWCQGRDGVKIEAHPEFSQGSLVRVQFRPVKRFDSGKVPYVTVEREGIVAWSNLPEQKASLMPESVEPASKKKQAKAN